MIPNSMPSSHHEADAQPATRQPTSAQKLNSGCDDDCDGKSEGNISPEADVFASLKQPSSQALAEYFSTAERIRSRFPRRKQEGMIVEAFCEGLSDGSIKASLERTLDSLGWTWNILEKFCHNAPDKSGIVSKAVASEIVVDADDPRGSTARAEQKQGHQEQECKMVKEAKGKNKNKKRKRRHISLVPTSEDEYDFL
jgi:hypothetical protein